MSSKRKHEGYLLIDHSNSPGLTEADAVAAGLPAGGRSGLFEAPTYRCNHCCRIVVINPARTRDREYCAKCNHYICDACGAAKAITGICRTVNQIVEETQEAGALLLP